MKRWLHGFAMCQSMFCSIPSPWNVWDEDARPLMLLFLPLVGLEIGILWWVLAWLVVRFELPEMIQGLALSIYPFMVTGFLHLDGFMDVTDAVGSCRSLERRREILKDSHVGAFAVIGVAILMLAQFACGCYVMYDPEILVLIPVVSRCGSALAVTLLRPMSTSQYAVQNIQKSRGVLLAGMLILAIVCGFLWCGKFGFALLGGVAGYAFALRKGYRSLEGMNGDISGYALTISELSALAVLAML